MKNLLSVCGMETAYDSGKQAPADTVRKEECECVALRLFVWVNAVTLQRCSIKQCTHCVVYLPVLVNSVMLDTVMRTFLSLKPAVSVLCALHIPAASERFQWLSVAFKPSLHSFGGLPWPCFRNEASAGKTFWYSWVVQIIYKYERHKSLKHFKLAIPLTFAIRKIG